MKSMALFAVTEVEMRGLVNAVPTAEFVVWSPDEVVAGVQDRVGPVPRWMVMARPAVLHKSGAESKRFIPRPDR